MPTLKQVTIGIVIVLVFLLVLLLTTFKVEAPTSPEQTIPKQDVAVTTNTIGYSVQGLPISVFSFGHGDTNLLFVGGIHGGYEWNTVVLAEEMITAIAQGDLPVPEKVTVHIIPNLNPDGLNKVLGVTTDFTAEAALLVASTTMTAGRFNANDVDINRNFDCKWKPTSTWRGETVSAGREPFSEPEAAALREYIYMTNPRAVVFWHSKGNSVYASECEEGRTPTTKTLMQQYARASDYEEVLNFDAYPISGDAESWLASIGIPAITVELETRTDSELERNKAGVMAILSLYGSVE